MDRVNTASRSALVQFSNQSLTKVSTHFIWSGRILNIGIGSLGTNAIKSAARPTNPAWEKQIEILFPTLGMHLDITDFDFNETRAQIYIALPMQANSIIASLA